MSACPGCACLSCENTRLREVLGWPPEQIAALRSLLTPWVVTQLNAGRLGAAVDAEPHPVCAHCGQPAPGGHWDTNTRRYRCTTGDAA